MGCMSCPLASKTRAAVIISNPWCSLELKIDNPSSRRKVVAAEICAVHLHAWLLWWFFLKLLLSILHSAALFTKQWRVLTWAMSPFQTSVHFCRFGHFFPLWIYKISDYECCDDSTNLSLAFVISCLLWSCFSGYFVFLPQRPGLCSCPL